MAATQDVKGKGEGGDQNFDYMFKLLIIGNSSVGKTSFLFRYADDAFTSAFVSTVGIDFKVKTVYKNDKRIKLQIWVWHSFRVQSQMPFFCVVAASYFSCDRFPCGWVENCCMLKNTSYLGQNQVCIVPQGLLEDLLGFKGEGALQSRPAPSSPTSSLPFYSCGVTSVCKRCQSSLDLYPSFSVNQYISVTVTLKQTQLLSAF